MWLAISLDETVHFPLENRILKTHRSTSLMRKLSPPQDPIRKLGIGVR